MHIMTKITLGVGVVMLIGSVIAMAVGGGSFVSDFVENPNGTEKWSGTSPTTYSGDFDWGTMYFVFVDNEAAAQTEIEVDVVNGNANNLFEPCENDSSCELYALTGYTYVGSITIIDSGTYDIQFTGNGEVTIRELKMDVSGLFAGGIGLMSFCCSFCVIGLGVIFIFALKDPQQQQMLLVQQQGTVQQVGASPAQQAVPASHMVAGQVHPAFTQPQAVQQPVVVEQTSGTILPPIGGQQPPNQGF